MTGDWDGVAKVNDRRGEAAEGARAPRHALASNTSHKVCDAVVANVDVCRCSHIADATADELVADRRTRVALLGTRFTMTEPFVREPPTRARGIKLVPI